MDFSRTSTKIQAGYGIYEIMCPSAVQIAIAIFVALERKDISESHSTLTV
jgi:hypothetical protein